LTTLLIVALLILASAFFVAAEFAAVAVRKVRVENLAEEGDPRAKLLLRNIEDDRALDRFVSASQVGITFTSLFLGIFGEKSLSAQLVPILMDFGELAENVALPVASGIVLLLLTIAQVIFGELVPKAVAMRYPETVAFFVVYPMYFVLNTLRLFIGILTFTGTAILKLLGVPVTYERHVHSPEEIELLLIQGRKRGELDDEEHRRLRRVLRFAERRVREVMVPRTRMKVLPREASPETVLETLANSPFTRLPVYAGNLDEIVGIVHVKDVAIHMAQGEPLDVGTIIRPVPRVPLAMPMDDVLDVMRRERAQMAMVLDEYGGTAGLVTMENLVEDILGEVQDEFDREAPSFARVSENEAVVRADLSLADLTEHMEVEIEDEDVHTVGGLAMKLLGRPPRLGDRVTHDGWTFEVEEVRGTRVQRVRVRYQPPAKPEEHF